MINHFFLSKKFLLEDRYDQFAIVTIGNDVWIGANVTIVNGVTIGDGAVIGANSIVTKDIPPYSIYGGVPAKCIRMRFEQNQIDFLLKILIYTYPYQHFIYIGKLTS